MGIYSFRDLKTWQRAHQLVLEIYAITDGFPDKEKFALTTQIRRSPVSICANIAEGIKKTRKDFIRFLDISQGSLEETKYHLILSRDLKYISETSFCKLYTECEDIGRMLTGLARKLK